jgi:hypothetical protein
LLTVLTQPEPLNMIIDRYDPINLFELVPKLKLQMEPELAQLDRLLDDDVLFEQVKADLTRRYPNSGKLGRHSTPVASSSKERLVVSWLTCCPHSPNGGTLGDEFPMNSWPTSENSYSTQYGE